MVKVLLVEDDPTMFDLLNTLLTMEGFDVDASTGKQDILAWVKQSQPDVILLDVHLRVGNGEELNGFDLLSQIRADSDLKDRKIIMSSGIDFRYKSEKLRADGFLLKPYMPDELINLIKGLAV